MGLLSKFFFFKVYLDFNIKTGLTFIQSFTNSIFPNLWWGWLKLNIICTILYCHWKSHITFPLQCRWEIWNKILLALRNSTFLLNIFYDFFIWQEWIRVKFFWYNIIFLWWILYQMRVSHRILHHLISFI